MVKRGAVVLLGALLVLFLIVASWPFFVYEKNDFYSGITGNSVRQAIGDFYETSSVGKRIFILAQAVLLIVIIVAALIVLGKFRSREKISKTSFMKKDSNLRSRTDLDILYEMLKAKKEIRMESIEDTFKVSPEVAIEWSKILENGDLADIDYPRFGKPILKLASVSTNNFKIEKQNVPEVTQKKKIFKKKVRVSKERDDSKKSKKKKVKSKKKKTSNKKTVKKVSNRKKTSSKKR